MDCVTCHKNPLEGNVKGKFRMQLGRSVWREIIPLALSLTSDTICFVVVVVVVVVVAVVVVVVVVLFCGGVFLIRTHQQKHLNIVMN